LALEHSLQKNSREKLLMKIHSTENSEEPLFLWLCRAVEPQTNAQKTVGKSIIIIVLSIPSGAGKCYKFIMSATVTDSNS
jgi:hypothetical protein